MYGKQLDQYYIIIYIHIPSTKLRVVGCGLDVPFTSRIYVFCLTGEFHRKLLVYQRVHPHFLLHVHCWLYIPIKSSPTQSP